MRTVIIPEAQINHKRPLHQKCISYAEIHRLQQLRCPRQIRRIRIPKLYDHECCFRCHALHGRICRGSPISRCDSEHRCPMPRHIAGRHEGKPFFRRRRCKCLIDLLPCIYRPKSIPHRRIPRNRLIPWYRLIP